MPMQRRILIADDEPEILDLLALALREYGYQVDVAATAGEASSKLDATRYELFLVDWWLPDGDGILLANKAADLGAKCLIMTGYPLTLFGFAAERHELVRKPITPTDLLAKVERRIGAPV